MMSRELFVLSTRVWDCIEQDDPQNMADLAADLQEHNRFHLPFDEVDCRVQDTENGETLVLIRNLCLTHNLTNMRMMNVVGIERQAIALGEVHAGPSMARWIDERDDTAVPGLSHEQQKLSKASALRDEVAVVLILALAARNSEKKVVENKRARLGIGKAENRRYARITYVDVPKQRSERSDREGLERASPMMHLRRGHDREQHFGKDNALSKRIWIAPTWVNIDDDYQPRKEYRIREVT